MWGGMGEDGDVSLIWDLPTEQKVEVRQGVRDRRSRKERKRREGGREEERKEKEARRRKADGWAGRAEAGRD